MKRKGSESKNCKNNLKNGVNSYLPLEILFSILVRSPAEDLLQAKRVCRLWYSIITGSDFPVAHLEYWKSSAKIIARDGNKFHSYIFFDIRTMKNQQLYLGNYINENTKILDSLDGLVLFSIAGSRKKLYICNPTTQKFKCLLCITALWDKAPASYKLVFDPAQQKYKVFGFCYRFSHLCINSMYFVLTLNSDEEGRRRTQGGLRALVWRNVEDQFLHCPQLDFNPVAIGRVLYWIVCIVADKVAFVQSMDIVEEVFKERIPLPRQPITWYSGTCRLLEMEMRGSLYVAILETDSELGIWRLKDQGKHDWIKQHSIILDSILRKPISLTGFIDYRFRVLYAVDIHDSVLLKLIIQFGDLLCSYNIKNQEFTEFTLASRIYANFSFVPSLISWD